MAVNPQYLAEASKCVDCMSPSQKDNATVFLLDNIALNLASGGGIHELLSPSHQDTVPSFVLRGSLVVGNSNPLWEQLPIGEGDMVLRSNGADPFWAKLALNTDVIGTLAIVNGGTNSSTALNSNRIMVSSGGKIVEATALTNGQLLIGSTGAAPVAASLIAGANITITPGAGSITIAAATPIGTHSILDAAVHTDSVSQAVIRGSLIYGNSTPKWDRLAIGAAGTILTSDGTDVSWATPAGAGTVTSFSAGNLIPLFTTSVATAATTPALTFSLSTQSANLVFAGPASGVAAGPTFRSLVALDLPATAVVLGTYGSATQVGQFTVDQQGRITSATDVAITFPGGFSGFADPSALVGLTPVNGAASTSMRSDSAPALDVTISPTWPGTHTFTASATIFGSAANALNVIQIVPPAALGSNMVDLFSDGGPGYNAIRKYFSTPFQVEIASSGSIDFVTDSNGNETGATVKFITNALRGGAQTTLFTFFDNGSLVCTPTAALAVKLDPFGAAAGNTSEIRFLELVASGTNYTGFKAPDSITASEIYVLPDAAPAANRFLRAGAVAAGVSTLSWAQISLTADVAGVLPVANGGSGVTTAFTPGSVIFTGASGAYAEDNANFFWDDTNDRLGLGVAAPLARLQVTNSASATIGVIVKAAAAQSANIMEWQNSSAVSLVSIASTGAIRVPELSVANLGAVGTSIRFTNGVMDLLDTPSGTPIIRFIGNGDFLRMGSGVQLSWSSNTNPAAAVADTFLSRSAVHTLTTPGSIQLSPFGAVAGNTGEVRFLELAAGGVNYTGFKAPDAITASEIYVLPTAAPSANRFLQAAAVAGGVSALSWAQASLTADVSGILPVANGGSGTSTAFTTGSVVFAGASGVFTQDNANFFWDNTNKRLGIGVASPLSSLDVFRPASINGDSLFNLVIRTSDTSNQMYGGGISFGGYYNGTTSVISGFSGIQGYKENSTPGDYAGGLRFTTRINGGTPTQRMAISSLGYVGIGTNPVSILHVYSTGNVNVKFETTSQTTALLYQWTRGGTDNLWVGIERSTAGQIMTDSLANAAVIQRQTNDALQLGTNNVSRLIIDGTGNVGIGNTAPLAKFHVSNSAAATVGSIFKAAAAQSADITEWQNSSAVILTKIDFTGNVGVRMAATALTAYLHIAAGTTTASTSPIKLTSGTSMTAAEAGAVEFTTDDLFFTITTGAARKRLLMADATAGLTSGKMPIATTNGRLIDLTASAAYTPTNVVADRSFDAATVLTPELANVVGAIIADLQAKGILG